jgi:hypothetical protein
MFLFNKLIRVDILLAVSFILSIVFQAGGFWRGFFGGIAAVCFLVSLVNHINYYKQTKKWY